jgi:predicted RND superfamily exporter protein
VRVVGPVMALGALLVAAGFAVRGLGHSQPMRMLGSLAAAAMAIAFALTFLLVPALLRRVGAAQEEVS